MAKITGIGGVFLNVSHEVKKLLIWYNEILGLETTEYGINFLQPNELTLITFTQGEGNAALNFTVDHIEEFLNELKSKGVHIEQDVIDYDYGKFAQIRDPFNNLIELWEPKHENYKKMVKGEIQEFNKS